MRDKRFMRMRDKRFMRMRDTNFAHGNSVIMIAKKVIPENLVIVGKLCEIRLINLPMTVPLKRAQRSSIPHSI